MFFCHYDDCDDIDEDLCGGATNRAFEEYDLTLKGIACERALEGDIFDLVSFLPKGWMHSRSGKCWYLSEVSYFGRDRATIEFLYPDKAARLVREMGLNNVLELMELINKKHLALGRDLWEH